MADRGPMKLSAHDHVLIHATAVLLAGRTPCDNDEMVRSILRDVLPDVTRDNPALKDLIAAASVLVAPDGAARAWTVQEALRGWHTRRLAAAWEPIRENYAHAAE